MFDAMFSFKHPGTVLLRSIKVMKVSETAGRRFLVGNE